MATVDLGLATVPARHLRGNDSTDLAVAEVLVQRGLYEDARAVLPRPPSSSASTAYRTRWAVTAAAIHYWGAGDAEAADRVLGDVGGPVAEAHRAGFVLLDGRPRTALAAGEKVLRDRQVPDEAISPAVNTAVTAASFVGRFDLAMAAIDRAGPARLELAQLGYVHCFALLMAGRVEQAHRMAEDGYRNAVAAGNIAVAGGWSTLRGQVAKARGDLATAIADLDTGSRLLEGYATCPVLVLCLAELAAARAMTGDKAGAQQTLRLAADRAPVNRLFSPWFALSQAWATAAGGDTTLAARQAGSAADRAMASGQFAVEAAARYDVARLGKPNAVRHRLATLAGVVRGPVVQAMAGAAAALARSAPGALDVATARFAELGLDLLAAETATAAAALRGTTSRGGACPDATTPLLRLTAPLLRLTRRERDVALLAATGLTSPAIGNRLGLSVRTVDNYLGRAYQKLGVTDRRDLAPLVIGDRPRLPIHSEGEHR
jgi:DNA-binding CsgD family transcriptional regulator